jgi:gliding-associated putative ABC transporter substrate-binding component GldG
MVEQKRDRTYRKKALLRLGIAVLVLIIVNVVFSKTFYRIDFTKEKRFTISKPTKELLRTLDENVYFAIYLSGELPAEYRKLQKAITEMLDEYNSYSDNHIQYDVVDPFDQPNDSLTGVFIRELGEFGIQGRQVAEQSADESSRQVIFPGARVFYADRKVPLNFLATTSGTTSEGMVQSALAMLEYNLSNTIRKLTETQPKKIVLIQGHGEYPPGEVGDIGEVLHFQQYAVSTTDLPNEYVIPHDVSAIIIAGPRSAFDEKDKFKIDQYIMHGGKVLWLLDPLHASLDSLRMKESEVTYDYELNLDDQLFTYGVRVNLDLIEDMKCNPIPLGREFQPWYLYPVFLSQGHHPITRHLHEVMGRFSSSIDTIRTPGVKKTILMTSSERSRIALHPVNINLGLTQMPQELFNQDSFAVAVLLEGVFNSVFRNRQISEEFRQVYRDSLGLEYREQSANTKMIVISDADIARNVDWVGHGYMPLGRYRWSEFVFANKDFILNCIDYLTDNYGLITTRNKEFKIRPLDRDKLKANKFKWQVANLLLPVVLVMIFGGAFTAIRRSRYSR